jgi:hypothetical protein
MATLPFSLVFCVDGSIPKLILKSVGAMLAKADSMFGVPFQEPGDDPALPETRPTHSAFGSVRRSFFTLEQASNN